MKHKLAILITRTIDTLIQQNGLTIDSTFTPHIERCKNPDHGDYASNIALVLAKQAKTNPRELAGMIVALLEQEDEIAAINIAGPGFINFTLKQANKNTVIHTVFKQKQQFGRHTSGEGQRAHIEFVSANPTGPLHVGHGRGAAYGSSVANLLEACGYEVHREYYVNDAGRQMHILATSIWLRYLEETGVALPFFPEAGYKGSYILDIAKRYAEIQATPPKIDINLIYQQLDNDSPDTQIDQLITHCQQIMGDQYQILFQLGLKIILDDIKEDLEEFGIDYQQWFHESQLQTSGALALGIAELEKRGYTYKEQDALWFKATEFGDEKDRVLVRGNGDSTYFASDVAYHLHKYNQGFNTIIDVFGADHHGYIDRINAFLLALEKDPKKLHIPLVQFAILYRGKEKVPMSTRAGSFVTLRELREEVGNDAARFFYVMRKPEQHLDFDLELAKSKSNENPVYYIQYAHARICSVFRQLKAKAINIDPELGLAHLDLLKAQHEQDLITLIDRYPEVTAKAANAYAPHQVVHYLQELATALHSYYNAHQFIVDDHQLRNARLCLITSVKQVLANALPLLGISTPETM